MANVRIIRRSDVENAKGLAPLYAVFHISGRKVKIHLDIHILAKDWDADRQRVRGHSMASRDQNLIIGKTLARINEILVEFRLSGEKLTPEAFKYRYQNPGGTSSFVKYALKRLDSLKTAIEFGTWRHHKSALFKLMEYDKDITFEKMTTDWLRVYSAHLRNNYGNSPNTIAKNLSIIRAHYMAGMREGFTKHNPFETFKMPKAEPEVTFLTEEELEKVFQAYREKSLGEQELEALGYWLWMAFTGMHISDMRELRIEQVFNGEIHYKRIKTGVKVDVPLSSPARFMMDIFSNGRGKGFLVNMPSDQWFNRTIKKAMAALEIQKNISAKSARHTFATIFYQRTKDIGALSKLLGHTSVRHTMVYTHIIRRHRDSGMSVFDSFL